MRECEATYVGQTKRHLRSRVNEHVKDINKKCDSPNVISEHRLYQNHKFDWENMKILNDEPSYVKKSVSEMIHIKKQTLALNRQSELLSDAYLHILEICSSFDHFVLPITERIDGI